MDHLQHNLSSACRTSPKTPAPVCLFREMTRVIDQLYHWTYSFSGDLVFTDCPNPQMLGTFYESCGFHDKILSYAKDHDAPYALGTYMGLLWFAVLQKKDNRLQQIHLLGPVFDAPVEESQMETFLKEYEKQGMSFPSRHLLISQMKQLPVIFQKQFGQLALMLHYCVNGTILSFNDLHFLVDRQLDETTETAPALYRDIRIRMQELMEIIRRGDISKIQRTDLSRGMNYSALPTNAAGIRAPLRALKDTAVIFASSCADAAIDGGISPEAAYAMADHYIGSIEKNRSSLELISLISSMFRQYVTSVYRLHSSSFVVSPEIRSCMDYIDLHPTASPELSQLARMTGYSVYYLSRKFKKETGISLPDYIKKRKIEEGALLLLSTDETLEEIAERLGFCSRSHFSEIFHKIMGTTPSAYRKKHHQPRRANTSSAT